MTPLNCRGERIPKKSHVFCSIVAPYQLEHIVDATTDPAEKDAAMRTLFETAKLQGMRETLGMHLSEDISPKTKNRTVYDARTGQRLPGVIVMREREPVTPDIAVTEAYEGAGATYDLLMKIFKRDSLDNRGMTMKSTVHYGRQYGNAFWNGGQMVYGDGDGKMFNRFTMCADVIGHELAHGLTQYTGGMVYEGQPGAMNEHVSDVFGSMVDMYIMDKTVTRTDSGNYHWIIGKGLLTSKVRGEGLRSMKAPGTAYDDPTMGKDPQPGHMKDYIKTQSDNGGVHLNSGIPNHAFYVACTKHGGYPWDTVGAVWYDALTKRFRYDTDFAEGARDTILCARELFGTSSKVHNAIVDGWAAVGVTPAP